MRVRLTRTANEDLEDIGLWIARDNPERARSYVAELRQTCLGLSSMAERFPLVSRYERFGIRKLVHGEYLVFYRIAEGEVRVIRILHGARDYLELLPIS